MRTLTDEVNRAAAVIGAERTEEALEAGRRILDLLGRDPSLISMNVHPLGFVHGRLLATDSATLRLHLWPDPPIPPQDPPWQVHRHNWPLRSNVLAGAVTNTEYEVAADSEGKRQLFAVHYEGSLSSLQATGERISCRAVRHETYEAGSSYEIPVDAFHATVAVPGRTSATLVMAGEETASPPLVVGTAAGEREYAFERVRLPIGDLEAILARLSP